MRTKFALLALFASVALGQLRAVEINFTSPAFENSITSGGTALTSDFTFALGSFGSFTPTPLNLAEWSTSFTVVPVGGTVAWEETFAQFTQTASLASNAGVFSTSNQAYIWGYNSTAIAPTSEWVLLTNVAWTFPTASNLLPTGWDLSDSGTVAVFGSIAALGSNVFMSTMAVSAIPEPSTYAAIVGALALGFVAYRRRAARVA